VAKVVVEVMLKPEILDPQGQAIARALPALGFDQVTAVRQGKRFELDIDGDDPAAVADKVAHTLLANPVIEQFTVRTA
jgi:phosphoribosylformylglycinamidine synthase subunit PurS